MPALHHTPRGNFRLSRKAFGFTMIELLIAITILAILVGIGAYSYTNAQIKAHDTRRKQDLAQIKAALSLYFEDNKYYPPATTASTPSWCSQTPYLGITYTICPSDGNGGTNWIPDLSNYIQKLPKDPKQASSITTSLAQLFDFGGKTNTSQNSNQDPFAAMQSFRAATDGKSRARLRSRIVRDAMLAGGVAPVVRNGLRLVFDANPQLILDKSGDVIGVDALVRAFRGTTEVQIDPHRIFINPPTQVRDGTFRTVADDRGVERQVPNYRFDPRAAFLDVLFDSIEKTPNPKGWRTRGTVTTIFADISDGTIWSQNNTYATARSGGTFTVNTTAATRSVAGQTNTTTPTYTVIESFYNFNTSDIPDTDTVSAAVFSLYGFTDDSATDFTIRARLHDWGSTLTSADYIPGANLSANTQLAYFVTSDYLTTGYNDFISTADFPANINKTGITPIVVASNRTETGLQPTGKEFVNTYFADNGGDGTTNDPKLVVTHAAAATTPTVTSPTVSAITANSATLGANVTADGGASINARGTCWGLSPAPTTNCLAQGGITVGIFTHSRTGLPSGTLIYYRGYATNNASLTGYSADDSFTTASAAPTVTLSPANTNLILTGDVSFNWTTTNSPTSCDRTSSPANIQWNATGIPGTNGSLNVTGINATTVFTITCHKAGFSDTTSQATVNVDTAAPIITSFTASPTAIIVGDSSTLQWTSVNATNCTTSAGGSGANSSQSVSPASTTTYTLTCTKAGFADAVGTVVVTVNQPSLPANNCSTKVGIYCYVAGPRDAAGHVTSFTIWSQLENKNDPEIYTNPNAQCTDTSPDSNYFNYCVKSE